MLVNLAGEVIGIGEITGRPAIGAESMGRAIPVDRARKIASELAKFGQVQRGYLGVQLEAVMPVVSARAVTTPGARVSSVGRDTPASEAGIRIGDVIVAANGHPVYGVAAIQDAVEQTPIGGELKLTIQREGRSLEITARPRARSGPPPTAMPPRREPGVGTRPDAASRRPGEAAENSIPSDVPRASDSPPPPRPAPARPSGDPPPLEVPELPGSPSQSPRI